MGKKKPQRFARSVPDCVVDECDAARRSPPCGFICAGTPCKHPEHRDRWAALTAEEDE